MHARNFVSRQHTDRKPGKISLSEPTGILQEVSVIAAEDTRHTQKLCRHYKIHTPLTSYHDFNKEEKTPVLLELLKEEKSIALVSDAGTPLISDPGLLSGDPSHCHRHSHRSGAGSLFGYRPPCP